MTLRCDPATEAEFYVGASSHGAWDRLDELDLPVVLCRGEDSQGDPASFMGTMSRRIAASTIEVVSGATHFVPMERPDAVSKFVLSATRSNQESN